MQTEKIIQIGVLLLAFHAFILYFLYKQYRYLCGLVEDLDEDLRDLSVVAHSPKPFSVRFNSFREVPSDLTFVDAIEAYTFFSSLRHDQLNDKSSEV